MSDSDDDYMSDKYLTSAEPRSSLPRVPAKKRELQMAVRKEEFTKRQREEKSNRPGVMTNERLQESLKRPIESDNKGFQMLAKMGYKPGQSLGKNVSENEKSNQPIDIKLKVDRSGLGRDEALRELAEKKKLLRQKHLEHNNPNNVLSAEAFRKWSIERADERLMSKHLKKCRITCRNLDVSNNIEKPVMPWFWPEQYKEDGDNEIERSNSEQDDAEVDEDNIEYTHTEQMEMLTGYLRTSYNFCVWCGVQYVDTEDMTSNCPGLSKNDH